MRTKIGKWGNSAAARLPREALDAAGISAGAEVDVTARSGVIELRMPTRRKTIEELFAEAETHGPLEPPKAVDWGPDRGAEILPEEDWSDIAPRNGD